MTREEQEDAIDIIQSILDKYEEDECLVTKITIGDEDIKAFKMAIKALEQESKWIPVSERLPEEAESVLVYAERNAYDNKGKFRKKVIDIGWQVEGRWHIDGCNGVDGIAWMPLPQPYKGESEVSDAT